MSSTTQPLTPTQIKQLARHFRTHSKPEMALEIENGTEVGLERCRKLIAAAEQDGTTVQELLDETIPLVSDKIRIQIAETFRAMGNKNPEVMLGTHNCLQLAEEIENNKDIGNEFLADLIEDFEEDLQLGETLEEAVEKWRNDVSWQISLPPDKPPSATGIFSRVAGKIRSAWNTLAEELRLES